MSVIQRIRDKAAWIIIGAIAVALLAFIIQDAFYGRGSLTGTKDEVASVNGTPISHTQFEQKLDFYEQANNGQMPRNQLIGQLWDFMVNNEVMQQEYDKLGLDVGGNELNDVLFGNQPPQWMTQFFTDPKTGVFDVNTAKQQLAQIKQKSDDPQVQNFIQAYLNPTIDQTLNQKYQSLITEAIYVPKWMAEKTNADASAMAKMQFIDVPYSSISDSAVTVTSEDIEAYLKKHEKQYSKDDESRMISYVLFSAQPSATDSATEKQDLLQNKQDFASAADTKAYLNTQSTELPYYDSYLGSQDIQQPIKDTLFRLSPGEVYGPYVDGNNFVLAKMVDKRTIADSAKVRHILVATHQRDQQSGTLYPVRDDSAALKRLDSAIAEIKAGASFDSVCAKYSDDGGSANTGGVYDYFTTGKMDPGFNDFAFTGHVGETKTVQTMYGYHYVEILGQKGSQEGYKIAYLAKPISASEETDNTASNAAAQFAAASRTATQFQTNAKNDKLSILPSQEFKENDFTIPGLGDSRDLIKWAWKAEVGDVSEPVNVDSKYVVAMLTNVSPKGDATASSAKKCS